MDTNSDRIIALAPLLSEFNAFTALFAEAVERAGGTPVAYRWGFRDLARCDAVIFHWPEQFIGSGGRLFALGQLLRIALLKRTHGLKVVWVAHNVHPHDRGEGRSLVHATFLRLLDGIIYLSEPSRQLVREAHRLPRRIVEQVTAHGPYPAPPLTFSPPAPSGHVQLTAFGLVRPYKNLGELVDAARDLGREGTEVAIVGKRHGPDYAAALEARAAGCPALRLELSDTVIDETALDAAIDAAHGIVLPYRKILNSGSAILALSRARPVLVPATGSMPELAQLVGPDWVRLYEGPITARVLGEFADHVRSIPAGTAPDLARISWDRVTEDLRLFFGRLFREPDFSPHATRDDHEDRATVPTGPRSNREGWT